MFAVAFLFFLCGMSTAQFFDALTRRSGWISPFMFAAIGGAAGFLALSKVCS